MSELDNLLDKQQRKTFSLKLIVAAIVTAFVLAYLAVLLFAKGYNINVTPEEAVASKFFSISSGTGFTFGDSVYTFSESIKVDVGAHKYVTQKVTLNSTDTKTVNVELIPAPGEINFNISNNDKETNWYIDQSLVHVGSSFSKQLQPGNYTVRAESIFAQPYETSVVLDSLQTIDLNADIQPVSGSLTINTVPRGAQITINKVEQGFSPFNSNLTGGAYQVSVTKDGYQTLTESVNISYLKPHPERVYKLKPKDGYLTINAKPNDGLLLINGQQSEPGEIALPANREHAITFSKDGFYPYTAPVNLKPEERKNMNIKLKPEFGLVSVKSQSGVAIFVNGKQVAKGSFDDSLQAVPVTVELKREGYRTFSKTITPSSTSATKIEHKLLTEFEARRAEGKPLFISTLGIGMKPFRMSSYTMGSPVNQKGRRRNEHQVDVAFNRPVYVGTHEITEQQFNKFNPSFPSSNMPAVEITWEQAALYCNWLSKNEGLPPFYKERNGSIYGHNPQSNGYRMLMEAEWEWLAKKAKRAQPTVYPWGDSERISKRTGNFADKSAAGTNPSVLKAYDDSFPQRSPVGTFRAERSKIFDLAGNVSEWVHDLYTNMPPAKGEKTDYQGPARGQTHVYKGGNYKSGRLAQLRAAFKDTSDKPSDTIGFRIARYK